LADRSRAPKHSPGKLSGETIAQIIAARHRWNWGPRKLRVKLAAAHPHIDWPAESTIGEVLQRVGLTHRRQPRVSTPPYAQPFASVEAANQTWCADFKGWFRTLDGTRCDPFTLTDAHSRYLLRPDHAPGRRGTRGGHLRRRIPRTWTAAGDPYRQRCPLCQPCAGRPQQGFDALGEAGYCAGTVASGLATG
jgi:hypothetical protein